MSTKPLLVLLLAFTLLVLMHTAATPVFEAPDEVWHYAYVRWLAEGHGLPSMDDDASGANQEVAQPPLYYAVAALLSAPFPDDELALWSNPGFGYQSPGTSGDNKNMLIHTADEGWPWRGGVLTLHVARLTSLLFGLVTVVAAWGLGAETFRSRTGSLTTAMLVAFHPQFVFMCSVVSNDSAAAALSTAALWAVARVLRRGITVRRAALTGALVGLAALTKSSAILLLPLAGAALVWAAGTETRAGTRFGNRGYGRAAGARWRERWGAMGERWGAMGMWLGVYVVVALAIGGWWYGRNFVLYGDPLGIANHAATPWGRTETVSLLALLPELPLLLRSFWAAYGWGHATWPDWVYGVLWAGALLLLARSVWQIAVALNAVRRKRAGHDAKGTLAILIFALAWFGGILAALLHWMQQVQAPHGRLLFPAIGAWAVTLASQEAGGRNRESGIRNHESRIMIHESPTQSPQRSKGIRRFTDSQIRRFADSPIRRFADSPIRRFAHSLIRRRSPRSEARGFADSPIRRFADSPIRLFVTVTFALTALAPGARILATFAPPRLRAPVSVLRMRGQPPVGLDYAKKARLLSVAVHTECGLSGEAFAVAVKVGKRDADGTSALQNRAAPGETVAVKACWEALAPTTENYTVFVHLIGPKNSRVAERHTYPGLGRFPTSLWPVGRAFCDTYRLRIEPWAEGPIRYKVEVGLFDADTGARLPATRADGSPAEPPVVGAVSVVPEAPVATTPAHPIAATWNNVITLRGYDGPSTAAPGETAEITLHWEALRAPEDDLVAFVHLWQPGDASPLAQHDGPPRQGWYPTTVWQAGDRVPDVHPLKIPADLPPGTYPLWAGLYRAADSVRLTAEGPEGAYPYNLVPLGMLEIR